MLIDDEDCSLAIRGPEASMAASRVAKQAALRDALLDLQRQLATQNNSRGGAVLEGRDIGSVVFPDAELKIFLIASIQERASRRYKELSARGSAPSMQDLISDIRQRDANDSQRKAAPLTQTEDALAIDTSEMNIEQVVSRIIELAQRHKKMQ